MITKNIAKIILQHIDNNIDLWNVNDKQNCIYFENRIKDTENTSEMIISFNGEGSITFNIYTENYRYVDRRLINNLTYSLNQTLKEKFLLKRIDIKNNILKLLLLDKIITKV